MPDDLKLFTYYHEQNDAEKTVFLLHGTGANEHDLVPLLDGIAPRPNIVSLRGNVSEHGMLRFFKRTGPGVFDQTSIAEESEKLAQFIRAYYAQEKIGASKALFVGFSNGANMILATLFRHPELFQKVGILHGMLPFEPEKIDLRHVEMFMTSGENDPHVSEQTYQHLFDTLKKTGAELTTNRHEHGHQLSREQVEGLRGFLE